MYWMIAIPLTTVILAVFIWKLSFRYIYHWWKVDCAKPVQKSFQEPSKFASSTKDIASESFVHLHSRLYLSCLEPDMASQIMQQALNTTVFVVPLTEILQSIYSKPDSLLKTFVPNTLIEIFKFDEMACLLQRKDFGMKLVFCVGQNQILLSRAVFLIGCHLIMSLGVSYESTIRTFHNFYECPFFRFQDENSVSIQSCWKALSHAKSLNWVNFRNFLSSDVQSTCIDLDEHMHYSR